MTNIRQHREQPDLIRQLSDLNARVKTLESARRLGNASIDGGELTVKGGDIVVRNDNDEVVTRIQHGSMPSIQMHPDAGLDEYYAQIFAWEASFGATLEAAIKDSGGGQAGGKLLLQKGAAYLSHQPLDTGAPETYLSLSEKTNHSNHFRFVGKFIIDAQYSNDEAILFGTTDVVAGFGAASFAFDYPFTNTPLVYYSITGATANFNHCITAVSNSGFTVGWSDALAHTVSWIAVRT